MVFDCPRVSCTWNAADCTDLASIKKYVYEYTKNVINVKKASILSCTYTYLFICTYLLVIIFYRYYYLK